MCGREGPGELGLPEFVSFPAIRGPCRHRRTESRSGCGSAIAMGGGGGELLVLSQQVSGESAHCWSPNAPGRGVVYVPNQA